MRLSTGWMSSAWRAARTSRFLLAGQLGQPRIGKAHGFQAAKAFGVLRQAVRCDLRFRLR